MTVTPASFRTNHQEFADVTVYRDSAIQYWIDLAMQFVSEDWGTVRDYGIELFVAHKLACATIKEGGGDIFGVTGPITSRHVGEVGYSSNPQFLFNGLEGIGFWARTSFGIEFWQLAKMFGSGGRQF